MFSRRLVRAVVAISCTSIAACDHSSAPTSSAATASVAVTLGTSSLQVGQTTLATATLRDSNGDVLTGRTIDWSTSDASVATVSSTGLVSGVAPGAATVTAASEGKHGSAAITVSSPSAANILVGAGDIATCDATSDDSTANLLATIPGTVFTAGDDAYPNGSTSDFAQCYDPTWGRQKARTRPAPGNHEYNTSGAAPYFAYFGSAAGPAGRGYYSYDLAGWHVISLNSGIHFNPGDAQVTWLKSDLAASTARCTIAYWHHPRYSSGTTHGSQAFVQPLWAALYAAGAEIVVNGHEHNYERFAPQDTNGVADSAFGIREFVAGVGGASLYHLGSPIANSEFRDQRHHGLLKLELDAGSYKWWFMSLPDGAVADSGTGVCHGAPG